MFYEGATFSLASLGMTFPPVKYTVIMWKQLLLIINIDTKDSSETMHKKCVYFWIYIYLILFIIKFEVSNLH